MYRVWSASCAALAPLGGQTGSAALIGGATQRARARERRRSGGAGWGGTLAKRLWGASATAPLEDTCVRWQTAVPTINAGAAVAARLRPGGGGAV